MSLDSVKPTLNVRTVNRKRDANGQSGREPQRDGKPGQQEPRQQDQEPPFLNSQGQITGKTINITA